jgi:RecB family endonuclease NucS
MVELKRNEAGIEVVEQIEKYIDGLSKELNKNIKGIICLHKPDNLLKELVKTKENIELYTYGFEFKKIQ